MPDDYCGAVAWSLGIRLNWPAPLPCVVLSASSARILCGTWHVDGPGGVLVQLEPTLRERDALPAVVRLERPLDLGLARVSDLYVLVHMVILSNYRTRWAWGMPCSAPMP